MIIKRARFFSDSDEKKDSEKKTERKHYLDEGESRHRGMGRAAISAGLLGNIGWESGHNQAINSGIAAASALAGGYAGKKKAEKLDREGKSDEEILKGASRHGALVGGASGAGLGTIVGAINSHRGGKNWKQVLGDAAFTGGIKGASGAVGGYLGARKNTKVRLQDREKKDLEDFRRERDKD